MVFRCIDVLSQCHSIWILKYAVPVPDLFVLLYVLVKGSSVKSSGGYMGESGVRKPLLSADQNSTPIASRDHPS